MLNSCHVPSTMCHSGVGSETNRWRLFNRSSAELTGKSTCLSGVLRRAKAPSDMDVLQISDNRLGQVAVTVGRCCCEGTIRNFKWSFVFI